MMFRKLTLLPASGRNYDHKSLLTVLSSGSVPAQMFLRLQYASSPPKFPRSIPNVINNPKNKNNQIYDN
jgi:hypothetical protein